VRTDPDDAGLVKDKYRWTVVEANAEVDGVSSPTCWKTLQHWERLQHLYHQSNRDCHCWPTPEKN